MSIGGISSATVPSGIARGPTGHGRAYCHGPCRHLGCEVCFTLQPYDAPHVVLICAQPLLSVGHTLVQLTPAVYLACLLAPSASPHIAG